MLSRTISEDCGLQDQAEGEVVSIVTTEASGSSAESSGTSMALQHCPKQRQGARSLYPHINPSLDTGSTREGRCSLGERAVYPKATPPERDTAEDCQLPIFPAVGKDGVSILNGESWSSVQHPLHGFCSL